MKKFIKVLVVCICLFSMTGCTKYIKTNKVQVKNEETGQLLVKNIICKTKENEKMYQTTLANKKLKLSDKKQKELLKSVNFDKLQNCEEMKIVGHYEGIWTTVFVRPLAWIIIKTGILVKNYGLALIIVTILIRLIVWPFTKKTAMQSENLQKAQPELNKLEKKYRNKTDQQSRMMMSQEMMMIYKKNDISPLSGCLFSFFQIPLFFAFYEAISRIPAIFEQNFLSFQLGTSPITALASGHMQYLILIILLPLSTYFSFKLNSGASMGEEQQKQMNMMRNMMVIFITIAALSISSGIAIYWITSQVLTIIQNLMVKRGKKDDRKKKI